MSHPNKSPHFLITGASSGIGFALATRLIEQGAKITALGRKRPDLTHAAINFIHCDLIDLDRIDALLDPILQLEPLNGFINCAGFGDFGSIEQLSVQRIRQLIDVNLVSTLVICRKIIPVMKRNGAGDIILIGSQAGLKGTKRGTIYCASKFAIRGFAQALRHECACAGIRVSLINPGMVNTSFYRELDFAPGEANQEHIRADDIVHLIITMLALPGGTVIDEINLTPLKKVIQKK